MVNGQRYQLDLVGKHYPKLENKYYSWLHLRHIYRRVHSMNFNYLAMVVGKHRTGKSLTAVGFSHLLDETFAPNLEKRVVYYADEFMMALEDIRKNNIIGGAVVWDEAGVGVPSREWHQISNKAIGMACQVFGRYRPIIFFVTQDVSYIDSQIRKLFHGFYEMQRMSSEYAIVKPFNVSYNKRTGKVYHVYSRMYSNKVDDGVGKRVLKAIHIQRPPKDIEGRYDVHSKNFKDIIMDRMKNQTDQFNEKEGTKRWDVSEVVEDIIKNNLNNPTFLSKRSKPDDIMLDRDAIHLFYKVPQAKARFIKKQVEYRVNYKGDMGEKEED